MSGNAHPITNRREQKDVAEDVQSIYANTRWMRGHLPQLKKLLEDADWFMSDYEVFRRSATISQLYHDAC